MSASPFGEFVPMKLAILTATSLKEKSAVLLLLRHVPRHIPGLVHVSSRARLLARLPASFMSLAMLVLHFPESSEVSISLISIFPISGSKALTAHNSFIAPLLSDHQPASPDPVGAF